MAHDDVIDALHVTARAIAAHGLRAVLIGNAAARMHGVDVVTHDLDFLFADSAVQRRRLASVATELGAVVTRPFFRRSLRWRLTPQGPGVPIDFVCAVDGVRDPASIFARAEEHALRGEPVLVAALSDVIRSKRASGRARDLEVLPLLEARQRTR